MASHGAVELGSLKTIKKGKKMKTIEIGKRGSWETGYYWGYAAIEYRETPYKEFILNQGCLDGWFRREKDFLGISLGLCLKSLKITGKRPIRRGNHLMYKCIAQIRDYDSDYNYIGDKSEKMNLFVHDETSLKNILRYIDENNNNWRA